MISVTSARGVVLSSFWKELETSGYLLVDDEQLGLEPSVRQHIGREYFNSRVLRRYRGDVPKDRERARDVIRYSWDQANLFLRENDEIAIENRAGIPGRRDYTRTPVLDSSLFKDWLVAALSLIPPERRQLEGTFGVNMFRTFTDVVTKPHHDDEQFVFIYVVDKQGGGAETTLYKTENRGIPIFQRTLAPGELLVFDDKQFLHNSSPLVSAPGRVAFRDALICTVNYPDTYPLLQ